MNIKEKLVQLASHCYAMGRIDGEKGNESKDGELDRVVDNFINEDQPDKPTQQAKAEVNIRTQGASIVHMEN